MIIQEAAISKDLVVRTGQSHLAPVLVKHMDTSIHHYYPRSLMVLSGLKLPWYDQFNFLFSLMFHLFVLHSKQYYL